MLDAAVKAHRPKAICQEHAIFADVLAEAVVFVQDCRPARRIRLLAFARTDIPFYISDIRLVFYVNDLIVADLGELSYV